MLPNPQGTLSKVGIALLTAANSSMDHGVDSAYKIELACIPRPYYITLRRAHGLDSEFTKSSKTTIREILPSKMRYMVL